MFISYFRRYNVMKSWDFSDRLLNFHTISIHIHGKFMLESISRIHILLQFETVKFSPHSISRILAQKFANLSLKIMKHREKFIHVFHSWQKWWNKKSQSRSIHVNFHHDPSQFTISTSKKYRLPFFCSIDFTEFSIYEHTLVWVGVRVCGHYRHAQRHRKRSPRWRRVIVGEWGAAQCGKK